MNLFFLWLLAFPLLVAVSPRRLSRLDWAWFLGFGCLALWGLRYVIWFVFILTVLTAGLAAAWLEALRAGRKSKAERQNPSINITLGVMVLLVPLALLPGLRERWWASAPSAVEDTPVAAAEWLTAQPDLPGPLWSEIGFSSYLEFALPERPPWMDTRFEAYPVEGWQAYAAISNASYDWESMLDDTGARLLIISTQNQPDLLAALTESNAWCERYRDEVAVIYERGACQP
jgi:hypothetical protein